MRRYFKIIIIGAILIFFGLLVFNEIKGVNLGTSTGDGSTWPGYAQISLDHKKYDLNNMVNIDISYGHDYQYNVDDYIIISHKLVVYVIDGSASNIEPENGIILYEQNITGDELLSDDYKCDPGKWIFSKVKYNNEYEISVDFSAFDFDNGVIFIRFYETFMDENNIDGEIVSFETTHDNAAIIYFIKNGEKIQFSQRQFD
ncbi:hypothetical protein [Mariniplasma anaerobium]|uniref:Uncharacterized protein n=1 Tax=Mariniplasma anaerobium TaxID=2735436 RepID=A0A7U9XUQ8_9MOLU|nr:hypothetical protein [Mariniplasma anaerobium]BCR36210.1 hypothetical protein MPAN_011030 [Mariniplasma anaerobium]